MADPGAMPDRRGVVAMLAAAAGTRSFGQHGMTADLIVETDRGRWRGAARDGVIVFKGIRYAVAERFAAPTPPPRWAGVRDALAYGAQAPQTNPAPPPGPSAVIVAQFPRAAGSPPPRPVESEDCLFLNVWTPSLDRGRRLPVMVWLHGGFFYAGSGASGDGTALARSSEVVVVSLNHRLNAFGFTYLGETVGPEFARSGNAGMLDIIAALEWVRDNIEAFGGDPQRVTLFGQSGGGMKASFLLASPPAASLLHRVAVQSGPGLRFMAPDAAARATELLFVEAGLRSGDVAALRALPAPALLAAYHRVAARLPPRRFIDLPSFAPVLDPLLLPRQPYPPVGPPAARPVPLLIGWNAQEMSFFLGRDPDAFTLDGAGLRRRLDDLAGDRAAAIDALYRELYPDASPGRRYIQVLSDISVMLPTLAQAERHSAIGAPTYVYRFDRQSPVLDGKLGAFHTSEAPYVFNSVDSAATVTGGTPVARSLAATMSRAWMQFADTGNPGKLGGVDWPSYEEGRLVATSGDQSIVSADTTSRQRHILSSFLEA